MKRIIRCIIFIFIFFVLFFYTFRILWTRKNSISYFYEEPKNSLDVVYIGSSNAYAHFNTVLAYNLYGYKTGMLSADSQPFALVEYLIKESEKYQNPKVYVIDLLKCEENINGISKEAIRKTTDAMKFSKNRIDAINKLLSYRNTDKNEYIYNYFSFFMYHNIWKNQNLSFSNDDINLHKGYLLTKGTVSRNPQNVNQWKNDQIKIEQENQDIIIELINYIKEKNLNVIFVISKRYYDESTIKRLNYVSELLKEKGFNVINFNTVDELQIDFNSDLYDKGHLNVYGATKFTLYFGKYLKENYNLEDHRDNQENNTWNNEYTRFKKRFNQLTGENFDDILNLEQNKKS